MCDARVTEEIKKAMERRDFLAGVGFGAAAAIMPASAVPAEAQARRRCFSRVVDLTHTLDENFPTFFGTPSWTREPQFLCEG